jgi:pyridoxamine 5'-phosphate oxidase-like protein
MDPGSLGLQTMPSWSDVEAQAPELAARAREIFDARTHKTLATLRRDGSPRISGTEVQFEEGEMWIGSMWRAVKALDLQRDPRFALHSGSSDPPDWTGDAKVAGRAEEVTEPEATSHRFRLDVTELVVTSLGDPPDHIVIESWHEGRGVTRLTRT